MVLTKINITIICPRGTNCTSKNLQTYLYTIPNKEGGYIEREINKNNP
jgi:hypothetical protein